MKVRSTGTQDRIANDSYHSNTTIQYRLFLFWIENENSLWFSKCFHFVSVIQKVLSVSVEFGLVWFGSVHIHHKIVYVYTSLLSFVFWLFKCLSDGKCFSQEMWSHPDKICILNRMITYIFVYGRNQRQRAKKRKCCMSFEINTWHEVTLSNEQWALHIENKTHLYFNFTSFLCRILLSSLQCLHIHKKNRR